MKAVKETIGNVTILIQMVDEDLEIVGESQSGYATRPTGIADEIKDAYAKAKLVIRNIAEDIGAELKSLHANARPKEVEMEFNMGLSAQAGVWILSGTGDYALKVKMTWELGANEQAG